MAAQEEHGRRGLGETQPLSALQTARPITHPSGGCDSLALSHFHTPHAGMVEMPGHVSDQRNSPHHHQQSPGGHICISTIRYQSLQEYLTKGQTPQGWLGPREEQAAPADSAACLSERKTHSRALETPSPLCPSGNLFAVAAARGGMASYLEAQGREEQAQVFGKWQIHGEAREC